MRGGTEARPALSSTNARSSASSSRSRSRSRRTSARERTSTSGKQAERLEAVDRLLRAAAPEAGEELARQGDLVSARRSLAPAKRLATGRERRGILLGQRVFLVAEHGGREQVQETVLTVAPDRMVQACGRLER